MEFLKQIHKLVSSHATKLLGMAQGTIAAVAAVDGLIPAGHLKYWMGALGVLTFWRGYFNSQQSQSPP